MFNPVFFIHDSNQWHMVPILAEIFEWHNSLRCHWLRGVRLSRVIVSPCVFGRDSRMAQLSVVSLTPRSKAQQGYCQPPGVKLSWVFNSPALSHLLHTVEFDTGHRFRHFYASEGTIIQHNDFWGTLLNYKNKVTFAGVLTPWCQRHEGEEHSNIFVNSTPYLKMF